MKCPVILNTTEKLSLCTYMTNSESKVSHTHIHIVFKVGGLGYLIWLLAWKHLVWNQYLQNTGSLFSKSQSGLRFVQASTH